jgi:hypothetical protein
MLSLECSGPATTSSVANWISVQVDPDVGRCWRNFAQFVFAHDRHDELEYAAGSSVSKWVK